MQQQVKSQNDIRSLEQSVEIGFINPEDTTFKKTDGGFTSLTYKGKTYNRITLRRALPIGKPSEYISVADGDNKEIGIIKTLADFNAEQTAIIEEELSKRYYCPSVLSVKSVKDKMGYVYMELTVKGTGEPYEKNCAVNDVNRNIRMIDSNRLLIFDVDGNRYIINNLAALDKKSLSRLEPYMF